MIIACEIMALAGCAVVAYGAWLVLPAAGFIVGGGCLIVAGVAGVINASR